MIDRDINNQIKKLLDAGHSLLLLGPRQVGKTTLIQSLLKDRDCLCYNLMHSKQHQQFEQDPALLIQEVLAQPHKLIFIDEIQKVPALFDNIQLLIDEHHYQFILTGSSARKLKAAKANLLPGRLIALRLDPLTLSEYDSPSNHPKLPLKALLRFGELPAIIQSRLENQTEFQADLLKTYVSTYLEEEIRAESLARNVGNFTRFLKLAAECSGKLLSVRALSQDLGIPHQTLQGYYGILEDCLITETVEILTPHTQRHRLSKSTKTLFFDLGVVNALTGLIDASDFPSEIWGQLFEQWVGLTLLRFNRTAQKKSTLFYYRDSQHREIDWVIDTHHHWIPIEVKWSDSPNLSHCKHLIHFLKTYPDKAKHGYLLYPGPRARKLSDTITALPYHDLLTVFDHGQP